MFNIARSLASAGTVYTINQARQWAGHALSRLAFRSPVGTALLGGGLVSWVFHEKIHSSLNEYWIHTRKTIASHMKILSIYSAGTASVLILSSFKVIPVKSSTVLTVAKLGMTSLVSYKIYQFFSDQKEPVHCNEDPTSTPSENVELHKDKRFKELKDSVDERSLMQWKQIGAIKQQPKPFSIPISLGVFSTPFSPKLLAGLIPDRVVTIPPFRNDRCKMNLPKMILTNGKVDIAVFPFFLDGKFCFLTAAQCRKSKQGAKESNTSSQPICQIPHQASQENRELAICVRPTLEATEDMHAKVCVSGSQYTENKIMQGFDALLNQVNTHRRLMDTYLHEKTVKPIASQH